jgi:hypothetical protein
MFNALVRYPEEYRWARAFVKHVRLRAGIGGNRGMFGPCIGPRRQDLARCGVARECGPKGGCRLREVNRMEGEAIWVRPFGVDRMPAPVSGAVL